ncbi:MAG TPA: hypothetical protein VF362_04350 [Demequinaceae bacterium]
MKIRTFLASRAVPASVAVAGVVLLTACGGSPLAATDTSGAYPTYTVQPTEAAVVNPDLTPPGTILAVGESALIGYHTLVPDASGAAAPSKLEQPVHVTVTGVSSGSMSQVPDAFRLTGADAGTENMSVKKVRWEATIDGTSVLALADQTLNFTATGGGSYIVSDPSAISGCKGPATLGAAFDSGSTVTGCFLIVYLAASGTPDVELSVFRTPTEGNPIHWKS